MKNHALVHALLALLAFALLLGAYVYWLSLTRATERSVQELIAEVDTRTKVHEGAGSARDQLAKLEADEAMIQGHFVPTDDIVPFLESLESSGDAFGASVTVLSVGEADAGGKITLALAISGSFDGVMRTVGIIEHGAHASAVRSLTLDTGGDGVWNAAATVTILSP